MSFKLSNECFFVYLLHRQLGEQMLSFLYSVSDNFLYVIA